MNATVATSYRPSVLQLLIREKADLYAAYIPLFARGGIFIQTPRKFRLGDDVYLLLTLPGEARRYSLVGKVGWINPPGVVGQRPTGIGVAFPAGQEAAEIKARIEHILGSSLVTDRPTLTV